MCVGAGKVQRKFVLLGQPGAGVAAVIVEAQKFAFVYRTVLPPASHGIHQVAQRYHYVVSPTDRVQHVPQSFVPAGSIPYIRSSWSCRSWTLD